MPLVGSHQQGAFSTPTNGQPTDASVVLSNDNANRTTTNAHDADATIHIQSSVLASRPAAGTAGRPWVTSDGLRFYFDSGSVWNELDYLSKTAGGTVAGAVTLSASLTAAAAAFSGAVTTASVATSSYGAFAGSGNPASGASVEIKHDGTTGNILSYDRTGVAYKALVIGASTTSFTQGGIVVGAGGVTVSAGGLTVSSGTTAVQALTATTGVFSSTVTLSGVASRVDIQSAASGYRLSYSADPTNYSLEWGQDNPVGGVVRSIFTQKNNGNTYSNVLVVDRGAIGIGTTSVGAAGTLTVASGVTVSAGGLAVTGGITGTLSTAAQPNITSVGVLAAPHMTSPIVDSGGITVTGNSVVTGTFKASAQGLFGPNSGAGTVGFLAVSSDTVGTASAGAASLPAAPVGFLAWYNGSTVIKIPYYA